MRELAYRHGYDHGTRVGSWVIDGNTDEVTAATILKGYDNGDPVVMDYQPEPLSGEWADDPTPRSVLHDVGLDEDSPEADEALNQYELGFSDGFWAEVTRSARAIV